MIDLITITVANTFVFSKARQLAGNHFLEIIEGRERLEEMGRYVLYHGAQDIVFEAA